MTKPVQLKKKEECKIKSLSEVKNEVKPEPYYGLGLFTPRFAHITQEDVVKDTMKNLIRLGG